MRVCAFAVLVATLISAPASSSTSIAASGSVHSTTSTSLKIIRTDGTTLNASCAGSPDVASECSNADPGETAWGRATCTDGACEWTCLDVIDQCSTPGFSIILTGTVTGTDMCAGVLYLSMLSDSGGVVRAPCLGRDMYNTCDGFQVGDRIRAGIYLACGDGWWDWLQPLL